MNTIFFKWLLVISLLAACVSSCTKPAGPGGKASVKGKVYVKDFNATNNYLISEYYAPGETVYIMYGDMEVVGNNVKTGPDGTFEFLYLRTGHYKVFANSRDTSIRIKGTNKVVPVLVELDITGAKETVDVGDIVINK